VTGKQPKRNARVASNGNTPLFNTTGVALLTRR
jgi:hypothetical protein